MLSHRCIYYNQLICITCIMLSLLNILLFSFGIFILYIGGYGRGGGTLGSDAKPHLIWVYGYTKPTFAVAGGGGPRVHSLKAGNKIF